MTARRIDARAGDVVALKKAHPCGANAWEITRMGMDVGLRCTGCDRRVRLPRAEFERRYRGPAGADDAPAGAHE